MAADALAAYMRANNSFVVDVFQAQFRSSLTCPTCQQQSNTFDPFLCVSLPIPQKQLMPVYVTVLYIDQSPRQVKLGLTIGANDTIGEWPFAFFVNSPNKSRCVYFSFLLRSAAVNK